MSKLSLDPIDLMVSKPLPAAAGLIVSILILAHLLRSTFTKPGVLIQRYQWDTSALGSRKKRWMWDSLTLLREGYAQFNDRPWLIWTSEGDHVVLPPSAVDELKMLPDHTLPSSLREFMLPQYTFKPFAPWKLDWVNHVILHDLNKNMAKIFPGMSEEVDIALPLELPTSTDWTEVDISTQILRVICRVSGRAFVGTGLHRNDEWIDISCNYTRDLFLSALKLRAVPSIFRPLLALFLPDLHRVYRHNDRARALVQPILQQRERERDAVDNVEYSKPNDTIQWLHDLIPDKDKRDYAYQGAAQLAITAVSVQSTSKLIVNILLNLMKYDEYVPILKEEIETVLAESGGTWTLESMARLEKMDSFMRESLRFEPPLTATFQRRTLQPLKLSDGTELPKDTLICTPADAIAFDPKFYPDPESFDGLRFFKLRQEAEGASSGGGSKISAKVRHQFVATSKTQVQFGLGRHACPGRWFAGHVIKMVVAGLLLNYDLRFRDGEGKRKTFLFQTTNMPDPKTRILVRRKGEKTG
ncbi:hypothetical protein BDV06DRAFT_214358 [Aspergillus oleicola]